MEPESPPSTPARPPVPWNAGFDDRAEEYDRMRSAGHQARRRLEHLVAVVDRVPGVVLDVGAGTGAVLSALAARRPDRTFVGLEPLPNYVDFANDRARRDGLGNVRFVNGAAEEAATFVEASSVGLVISVDVLHHVGDAGRVLRQVRRLVTPAGRWHAMEPNRLHPWMWLYHVLTPGERTFPVRRFLAEAGAAGWELRERSRLLVPVLFPGALPPGVDDRLARMEQRLERVPVLAGAVTLELAPG